MSGALQHTGRRIVRTLPMVFLFAAFAVFVLRNWYIKAYSDPLAWITTAREFPAGLRNSSLPLGYPAFLWLAMKLAGPYYVFLANLPVLALLVWLVGKLAEAAARETEPAEAGPAIAIAAAALLLGFDAELLVYMTNPYRDPLSYVFLVSSLLALLRYVASPGRGRGRLALSGFLLGLAYCVREPSLVALGPMFLLGLAGERKAGRAAVIRSSFAFGAGLLAGALPLLYQTLVLRGQVAVSPYSVSQGRLLPGLHLVAFPTTVPKAARYLAGSSGWVSLFLFATGVAFAVRRRNRAAACLALLTAVYAAFYCFYWQFTRRYFFSAVITAAPVVAFGAYGAITTALRAAGRPRLALPLFRWIALGLALFTGLRLLAIGGSPREFRAAQARQFVRTIEQNVPAGSVVLSERELCLVIRTFTDIQSYPLDQIITEASSDWPQVRDRIEALRAEGRSIFFMKTVPPGEADKDETLLRCWYDLEPVAHFPAEEYRLERLNHGNPASLFRVVPWSKVETSHALNLAAPSILQINARELWPDEKRQTARLWLNGRVLLERVENGANYVELGAAPGQPAILDLRSNQHVPSDLAPVLLPRDARLDLNVGELSRDPHDHLLSPEFFREPPRDGYSRRLRERGSVTLPLPWREPMIVFAEFLVKRAGDGPAAKVEISADGLQPVTANVAGDGRFHGVMVPFTHDGVRLSCAAELAAEPEDAPIDLDRIYLYPVRTGATWELDVGSENDAPFLGDGFYSPEKAPDGSSARWTSRRALVSAYLARPAAEMELQIEYVGERPVGAPAPSVTLLFNEHPLGARDEAHPPRPNRRIVRAPIRADAFAPGANRLEILSRTWKPINFLKTGDTRDLGILVDTIRIVPRPAPPLEARQE